MAWEGLRIEERHIQHLALLLAVGGLLLLYFWPNASEYKAISPASLILSPDGQWVQVSGLVDSITKKTAGYSIRLCDEMGTACASVSVSDATTGEYGTSNAPTKGQTLTVFGEVASVQGNKFIRANEIRAG